MYSISGNLFIIYADQVTNDYNTEIIKLTGDIDKINITNGIVGGGKH